MIRRLVKASLRFRVILAFAALAVLVAGFVRLPDARRDVYPEFSPPTVEVQTEALGLSAEEVEELITVPLEADLLNGVAWVDHIRSESVLGLSSVTMVFKPDTDLARARQAVQERLAQAHALPQVSKPPQMIAPASTTGRVMMIGLTSDKLSLIDLSQIARWTIKPRLDEVDGVANVASFGQRDRQVQVQVDPKKLADKGVPLQDVVDTTGNALVVSPLTFLEASTAGTGGFIDSGDKRLPVEHVSPIKSAGDLAKVPVTGKPGLKLGDVATVVEGNQPLIGDAVINGGPGVLLVVDKLRDADSVDVTAGVDRALKDLAPALQDVKVDSTLYRPADYVRRGTGDLAKGALVGFGLLVVLICFAFYRWRPALVATVAVLTSMTGAALLMLWRGPDLNWLVLAGLAVAVGIVVDDAVTGTERIVSRLRAEDRAAGRGAVARALVGAAHDLRGSLAFATAFVLLPVLPAFVLGKNFGYFGRPLATSYVVAVAVSMVVALTVTPALGALLFLSPANAGPEPAPARALRSAYEKVLGRVTLAPRVVLALGVVLALAAAGALTQLGRSELPGLKERDFLVSIEAKPGTSLPEIDSVLKRASDDFRGVPGVRAVSGHAGRAVTGDQVVNVNSAELWVSVDPGADYGRALDGLKGVVARYADYDTHLQTYEQFRLQQLQDDSDGPIVVRVYGHEGDVLAQKAQELGAKLQAVEGVRDLKVDLPQMQQSLQVEVNLDKAAEYGIKPGDVRREAAVLLAGVEAGQLYYDEKVFEVVVWGTPDVRSDAANVANLQIETARGLVPLSTLADVRMVDSPNVIHHDGEFRTIDITAGVSGRSRAAVAEDVREIIAGTALPLEFRAQLLNGYVSKQHSDRKLLGLAVFAMLAMLLLLQACFGSWKLGAIFFLAMPVALAGGLIAALADRGDITIGATVGLLVLLGLATRNGVVLVRRYQQLTDREGVPFGRELVVRGAGERCVPAVTAALGTGLLVAPLALAGERPGLEIVHPMAVVVLGGLPSVLLVGLAVVPALYLIAGGTLNATERDLRLFEEELAALGDGALFASPPEPASEPAGHAAAAGEPNASGRTS